MTAGLFEQTQIRGLTLANRFVRSATFENLADEHGAVTRPLIDLTVSLVRGGVGLVLPGYAYVLPDGRSYLRQTGISDDEHLAGLADLARGAHDAGGRIALQIGHCGAHSDPKVTGVTPMGPSELSTKDGPLCRAMSRKDIDRVVQAFEDAAARAKKAGFDALQLHAAHGYLLSEFISPFYNRRTDDYGGSPEKRARLVFDVCRRVRRAVGHAYPVLIKLNCTDLLEDGLGIEDVVLIAKGLVDEGIDAIELSGGTTWGMRVLGDMNRSAFRTVKEEAYYREEARRLKREIAIPIILTGGIRRYETAVDLVESGTADYIGLCRPLIREPDLIRRWQDGDTRPSACVSDNACFKPIAEGQGPLCVHVRAS